MLVDLSFNEVHSLVRSIAMMDAVATLPYSPFFVSDDVEYLRPLVSSTPYYLDMYEGWFDHYVSFFESQRLAGGSSTTLGAAPFSQECQKKSL